MAPRAELYKQHAKACVQTADRIDNPNDREMLLKIARQWMQEAQLGSGRKPSTLIDKGRPDAVTPELGARPS
jgi:hypothetical protein